MHKPRTEETKQKISIGNKGKKLSEETKRKISHAQIGKKLSDETKRKISESEKRLYKEGKLISWNKGKKNLKHSNLMKLYHKMGRLKSPPFEYRFKKGHEPWWVKKGKKLPSFDKPNQKEQQLYQILQTNFPNEFKFVGDGSFMIERFNPDFINCNGRKLIIELFGDYWHSLESYKIRDKKKFNIYQKHGYRNLIIWEHELKNPKNIIEKIRMCL